MSEPSICYTIRAQALHGDTIVAFLADLPFTGFEVIDHEVKAYMLKSESSDLVDTTLAQLAARFQLQVSHSELPDINWNAKWEADYPEVQIENWLRIRAPFHAASQEFEHELIIHPEMSFGTGHHETTYMMSALMQYHSPFGKTVFDFGTGTGVLAILAAKLGATETVATDIDNRCIESARANAERNSVNLSEVRLGTQASLPEKRFDLILANINRGVLVEAMSALAERIMPGGQLWMSGILATDLAIIEKALLDAKLHLVEKVHRGDWLALRTALKS